LKIRRFRQTRAIRFGFAAPFLVVLCFLTLLDAPFAEESSAPFQQVALVDEDEVDRSKADNCLLLFDDHPDSVGYAPTIQTVHPQRRFGWSRGTSLSKCHVASALITRAPPAA
jgi:hypothetical protein